MKHPESRNNTLILIYAAVGILVLLAIISPVSAKAVADFTYEQGNPNSEEYLRVIFMGSLEGANASEDSQWVWNFGDGTFGTGKNVIHWYSADKIPTDLYEPIIFMVRLDVKPDGTDETCSKSYKVTIKEPALAAQFVLSATQGPPPLKVTVTDTTFGRHDVESFYFGYPGFDTTAYSLPATHVYLREGTYPVTLTVSRGDEKAKARKSVIVKEGAIYIGSDTQDAGENSSSTVMDTEVTNVPESNITEILNEVTSSDDVQSESEVGGSNEGDILFATVGSFELPDTKDIVGVNTLKSRKDRYFGFFDEIMKYIRNLFGIRVTATDAGLF